VYSIHPYDLKVCEDIGQAAFERKRFERCSEDSIAHLAPFKVGIDDDAAIALRHCRFGMWEVHIQNIDGHAIPYR